jgi:predicted dehydrogenase
LMDLGVHMLDIALYLLDEPPVRAVSAATYAEFGPRGKGSSASPFMRKTGVEPGAFDVEDLSTAFLRLHGGGTLLLESSWAQWIPKDQCYVAVYGSDGGASIEWGAPNDPERSLNVWTEKAGVPATLHPSVPPDGLHTECVMDFIAKVRSGDYTNHRGKQALARAVVIEACYASAEKGTEITLDS